MKLYKIFRYGIMKRFRRGVRLSMALTFNCNLRCPYCVTEVPTGHIPDMKESTLDELKHFVNHFPYRIRELKLTGGSPELHPNFVEFANWLLDKGIFLQIFTNLMHPQKLNQLKKTYRLMFISTYHHTSNPDMYRANYDRLNGYRIRVEEIADGPYFDSWHVRLKELMPSGVKYFSFSHLKPLLTEKEMRENKVMLRVSPDLQIFTSCYGLYERG